MRVVFPVFLLVAACELEPPRAPEVVSEPAAVAPPDSCFARTDAVLDAAERELATDPGRALVLARAADGPFREELRGCGNDDYARTRARRLAVRNVALRLSHASSIDVLRDLGDETFETGRCRCAEHLRYFAELYPNFVHGDEVAVRAMDRLPITPQPDGRLTVEYMETVENRLALLEGDVFAMTLEPSSRNASNADVELRVDGADVIEGEERKRGAHVALRVPLSDAPSSGPVVLLVRRSEFHREGTTWRASARLAFATR